MRQGFSAWTLQPCNEAIAAKFSKYTRSEVRKVSFYVALVSLFFTTAAVAKSLKEGHFKDRHSHAAKEELISLLYIASTLVVGLTNLTCYLVAQKYLVAVEFIIPLSGLFFFIM